MAAGAGSVLLLCRQGLGEEADVRDDIGAQPLGWLVRIYREHHGLGRGFSAVLSVCMLEHRLARNDPEVMMVRASADQRDMGEVAAWTELEPLDTIRCILSVVVQGPELHFNRAVVALDVVTWAGAWRREDARIGADLFEEALADPALLGWQEAFCPLVDRSGPAWSENVRGFHDGEHLSDTRCRAELGGRSD